MDINLESKYLEAFDMLYIQYSPRLKHFLTGFIKNRDEASDMTQDIFYKIWTNRETISKVDSFKAYLFRMARNMIYDYYEHSLIVSRKDGLSNEEIAQRLNISKRTVENHMTQALAELRKIAYSTLLLFF